MDDSIARMRAEMDQAREGVREFAGSLWAFYSELLDRGFSCEQAFVLTRTFLSQSMRNALSGEDEE